MKDHKFKASLRNKMTSKILWATWKGRSKGKEKLMEKKWKSQGNFNIYSKVIALMVVSDSKYLFCSGNI